jgi:hypothetical protein
VTPRLVAAGTIYAVVPMSSAPDLVSRLTMVAWAARATPMEPTTEHALKLLQVIMNGSAYVSRVAPKPLVNHVSLRPVETITRTSVLVVLCVTLITSDSVGSVFRHAVLKVHTVLCVVRAPTAVSRVAV